MKLMRASEKGFTLFELIVTLIILGVVAGGATSLFSNVVEGMILTRNVTTSEEKIQTALTRLTHELANANLKVNNDEVVPGRGTGTTFSYYYANDPTPYTVQLTGSNLTLNGNVLLDNVTGFTTAQNGYSASFTVNVLVPTVHGATPKSYSPVIDLSTQRF